MARTERALTCLTGQQRGFLTVFYGGRLGGANLPQKAGCRKRAKRLYWKSEAAIISGMKRAALPVVAVEAAFAAKRAAPSMHRAHSAIMREYS